MCDIRNPLYIAKCILNIFYFRQILVKIQFQNTDTTYVYLIYVF
jgi:hypothetical protein